MAQGFDQIPVEPSDGLQRNLLRADSGAFTDIGAAAETFHIVLSHHANDPGIALRLALSQQTEMGDLRRSKQHG